jgi:hypothetical protein
MIETMNRKEKIADPSQFLEQMAIYLSLRERAMLSTSNTDVAHALGIPLDKLGQMLKGWRYSQTIVNEATEIVRMKVLTFNAEVEKEKAISTAKAHYSIAVSELSRVGLDITVLHN